MPHTSHAQIIPCVFMEDKCQYTCHIRSCSHQWCSQNHYTQTMPGDNDTSTNDYNDPTAWLHMWSWPLGQTSQKTISCNFTYYVVVIYKPETKLPLKYQIYATCTNYSMGIHGEVCQYIWHVNSPPSTMWPGALYTDYTNIDANDTTAQLQ